MKEIITPSVKSLMSIVDEENKVIIENSIKESARNALLSRSIAVDEISEIFRPFDEDIYFYLQKIRVAMANYDSLKYELAIEEFENYLSRLPQEIC